MEMNYIPQTTDCTDGPSAKRRRVQWASEAEHYNVDSLESIPVYNTSIRHLPAAPRDVGGVQTQDAGGVGKAMTEQQAQALEEQQRAEAAAVEAWEQEERRKFRLQQELYEVIH